MPILTLPNNPPLQGLARMIPDITYSTATGIPLKAAMLVPWNGEEKSRAAMVFVQGSGWTFPDINFQIPQLSTYAQAGYVVMTITHRSRRDGHPFPAFLQDVKCAIRYLRANAEEYGIDPTRIGILGTSSGANAALLAAMTGDDPRYKTEEYGQYSDAVCCMAECFGPTCMEKMPSSSVDQCMKEQLCGDRPITEVLREMSPCCVVNPKKDYPPMLLIHGDADVSVPYEQAVMLYDQLCAMGKDARLIRVQGAPHEGSFWSRELHRHILSFLDAHLLEGGLRC